MNGSQRYWILKSPCMLFFYITVPLKAWEASKNSLTRLSAAQLDFLQHFAAVRLGSPLHDAIVGLFNSPLHDAEVRFDSLLRCEEISLKVNDLRLHDAAERFDSPLHFAEKIFDSPLHHAVVRSDLLHSDDGSRAQFKYLHNLLPS
jgi:hypothetical protein